MKILKMKLCAGEYKTDDIDLLNYFDAYPFKLSAFQKFAIEGIVRGNDILVTAHTGSGKTLPGEFAITFFVEKGKKVIYTSPIKALSNQKFYEFSQKFPDISFGLLTGDIKMNPDADVLIMTTEILQKQLYNVFNEFETFDLDFENLGCVIFDEVHYINDAERGHVWEETIMNLPQHVQMVMLSATINNPQSFAKWCETKYIIDKEVWLIPTYSRIVPLTHYGFVVTNASCFKTIKDKEKQKEIRNFTNKLIPVKTPDGLFVEKAYYEFEKFNELHKKNNLRVTTRHVINEVCNFMVEQEMLPALCFVLSRKQLEKCAKGVTSVLLEDDSKVPYIIQKECETIIRRLPNFKEYLNLPEYHEMVKLLEKGIAIHHAGVMPVLREMVEILYAKGYIKLLFATETFAVGVNMPTKTVLFTDVHKHDGHEVRVLHPHEYTQMAGRAGRRGIDKVGNVILLYNLFSSEIVSHRSMLYGQPAKLESKFKINPLLMINLIATNTDIEDFMKGTMLEYENNEYKKATELTISLLEKKSSPVIFPIEEYDRLQNCVKTHTNRKRKDFQKQLDELLVKYPNPDIPKIREQYDIQNQIKELRSINNKNNEITETVDFLKTNGFVEYSENVLQLTTLGVIASQLNEADPLILSKMILNGLTLSAKKLAKLFSCFTEIRVNEDCITYRISDKEIGDLLEGHDLHYDLLDYVEEWYDCENEEMCKLVIQKMEREKGIFLGDFVKAMLKIVNIAREVEKVAVFLNIPLMEPVSQIPNALLKFMVNNQSLYI
jgi:superfamily II RNA helicase